MGYNGNNRRFKTDMFPKRSSKQMQKLISGLITGLLVAPIVAVDTISKSSGNNVTHKKTDKKTDKKIDALSNFFIFLLFITPLYTIFTYFGFKIELFFFPIIGELLLFGSAYIFFGFGWVAISDLIKAYKKGKKDCTKKELPHTK